MLQLFNHQRRLKSGTNGLIYMDFPQKIKPFGNAPPYLGLRNKIPGPQSLAPITDPTAVMIMAIFKLSHHLIFRLTLQFPISSDLEVGPG